MAINQEDWNVVRNSLTDGTPAAQSFVKIEKDVERLIQEVTSLQTAERELRNALEEPGGAEIRRR